MAGENTSYLLEDLPHKDFSFNFVFFNHRHNFMMEPSTPIPSLFRLCCSIITFTFNDVFMRPTKLILSKNLFG